MSALLILAVSVAFAPCRSIHAECQDSLTYLREAPHSSQATRVNY